MSSAASRLIDQLTDSGPYKSSEPPSHHSKSGSGLADDGKRSIKSNADCDKVKGLKANEPYDANGKKVESGDLKRKQKRPRDDKSDSSTSVSILPIITALTSA